MPSEHASGDQRTAAFPERALCKDCLREESLRQFVEEAHKILGDLGVCTKCLVECQAEKRDEPHSPESLFAKLGEMVDKVTPELRNFMAWNFRVAPKILNLAEVVGVVAKKELRKPSVLVELRIWEARDVLQMGSCEEELAAGTKAAEHRKDVGVQLDHGLLIGKGGSANVYLVDYLGKNRAVKKITNGETPTTELEVMKTLLNESAHIVRIIIGGPTSEHRMMLMMEYMPGGDLATFISSCKDNKDNKDKLEKHRLGFLRDICDGMAYIHDKGLVHRDLKSANVLLSENLEAKIADFGLTKGENDATTKAYNFTTHSHAAPEVFDKRILKGKPGGWERDVYAFAIICWELVAVDKPWRDKHTGEPQSKDYIMSAVLEGTRPPIPQDAPPNLIGVMGQGWHRELTKRPTAARLKRMLNEDGINYRRRLKTARRWAIEAAQCLLVLGLVVWAAYGMIAVVKPFLPDDSGSLVLAFIVGLVFVRWLM